MKIAFKQVDSFLKSPDPQARVILVYGPDQGLVKERATILGKTVTPDLNDPFNVATLTADKILADPSLFYDEAAAQSLMGGDRLVIIKDGSDGLSVVLKDYLENPSSHTLVIIEAGDLGTKSSLRKLCEAQKKAAALPCYVDDERTLGQIIRDMCMHAGYGIDSDALMALSSALVGDRTIARNEIEKLLLYKDANIGYAGFSGEPVRQKRGQISLDDVTESCGDVRDWSMDRFVYAIADGNIHIGETVIDSMLKDQVPPVALLRALQSHFWRLLTVKMRLKNGEALQEALKTLNPPLFWKVEDDFKRQLGRWAIPALESVLDALSKAEATVKQSGYNDESILKNTAMQIARYNPSRSAA